MKTLKRLSKKAIEFCESMGYDVDKIKELMKSDTFALQICETKEEMDDEGAEYMYPYIVWNPYNFDIEKEYE